MKGKILITGNAHPYLMDTLKEKGYEVIFDPKISYRDMMQMIDQIEGIVATTRIHIDRDAIDKAKKLKWIGRLGSGMDQIDVPYAELHGIRCVNSPEGNRNAVAEHVLSLILCLMNRVSISHEEIKHGEWKREANRGEELCGKTVGIIGYGNTGSSVAKVMAGLGVQVLAYDKYKSGFSLDYIKQSSLDELMKKADVITFHVPLTEETFHYADDNFFNSLGKKVYFINASRGKVLDTNALIRALDAGLIKAAALDVLENEHLDTYSVEEKNRLDNLLSRPEVILTSHIAGYSHESFLRMPQILLKKLHIV